MLVTIYSHLDSTSTVASAPASAAQVMSAKTAASWGSQVEGSRAHGASTYVRDLGQGRQVITHVLWA
jgi:hypothetical protein